MNGTWGRGDTQQVEERQDKQKDENGLLVGPEVGDGWGLILEKKIVKD